MSPASGQARSAADYLPASKDLDVLRNAAVACKGCDLYSSATQTVFGEGPLTPRLMLVGEAPGDKEDTEGAPFVGPAGLVLSDALDAIGVDRSHIYLTNAVKHFKWRPAGRRRIHETPRASEVRACRPWLEAEVDAVRPQLIVLLGATAVASLLGPDVRVLANRGRVRESDYGPCLITVHPSSILRVEPDVRDSAFAAFVADLKRAVAYVTRAASTSTASS